MKHPFAWVDALAAEGVDFRAVANDPAAWRAALPTTEELELAWSPADAAADAALREGAVPVLEGPSRADVFGGRAERSLIVARPGDATGRVWVALHRRYPAALWIPVDDAAAFRRVLATYFQADPAPPTATRRVTLGMIRDWDALEERLLDANPFCEAWATDEPLAPDAGTAMQRVTVRSLHTHSLADALQYGGLVVGTLRYAPAPDAIAIGICNQALGRDFPTDLPVDLAATLIELHVTTGETLRRGLAEEGGPADLRVLALIAVELVQADLQPEDLAAHARDESAEVRRAVVAVAGRRGYRELLATMLTHEPSAALRDQIRAFLPRA